jgi:hypothetical protein
MKRRKILAAIAAAPITLLASSANARGLRRHRGGSEVQDGCSENPRIIAAPTSSTTVLTIQKVSLGHSINVAATVVAASEETIRAVRVVFGTTLQYPESETMGIPMSNPSGNGTDWVWSATMPLNSGTTYYAGVTAFIVKKDKGSDSEVAPS